MPAPCGWCSNTELSILAVGSDRVGFGEDRLHGTDAAGWVNKAEIDSGKRAGVPTDDAEKLKALERENRELRQANEILRKASAYFAQAELDRRCEAMIAFIDDHRGNVWGRADLQSVADRPVDLPCARRPADRPETAFGPCAERDAMLNIEIQAGFRGELRRLRRAQGLAAIAARRLRRSPAAQSSG